MTTQATLDSLKSKQQIAIDAQAAVTSVINGLAADPDVNPLQAQLDAAIAQNAALKIANSLLQGKIDAAKAALA